MRGSLRFCWLSRLPWLLPAAQTANGKTPGHLRRGRRGRQRHAVRVAVRRVAAHRHRQCRRRRGPRRRSHHGRRQGRRPHADRPPDHHALARRSLRRHGGAGGAHSDPAFHRPRRRTFSPPPPPMNFCRRPIPRSTRRRQHTVAKPGDRIPVAGLDVRVRDVGRRRRSRRRCPAPAGRIPIARASSRGDEQCRRSAVGRQPASRSASSARCISAI